MTKRTHYTNSWLGKTLNKDYSQIVHDIVMDTFKFPNKKLKRSSAMENLTLVDAASARSSLCYDSAYATSEESSTSGSDLHLQLNEEAFREDSLGFESDEDTLVDKDESSSETVKSFYEKRRNGVNREVDSLLYDSCEDLCNHLEAPSTEELNNPPEDSSFADSSNISDLLEHSTCTLSKEESYTDKAPVPNSPEENSLIADTCISSKDTPAFLEPSNTAKFCPLDEELQYEQTIGKIYFEENRISQLHNLLGIGKKQPGYVGSIPHITAATKILIANLTREALIVSIAKKYFAKYPTSKISCPKGQISVENIQLDTDCLGRHGNLPPCYYLVVLQHETTVLESQVLAPDAYGHLHWTDKMVFDDISHDFTIFMSLYKLQVKQPDIKNFKWKKLLKNKPLQETPLFKLVGKKEITKTNIHKTAFEFSSNERLYVDFNVSIHTGQNLHKTPMKLSKIIMKNKRETKMICNSRLGLLDGTDLKLFQGFYDTQEPQEVISMVRCKRCRTHLGSINTLEIEYEKTHSSGRFYLTFENPKVFREWRMALNGAMLVSKKWNL